MVTPTAAGRDAKAARQSCSRGCTGKAPDSDGSALPMSSAVRYLPHIRVSGYLSGNPCSRVAEHRVMARCSSLREHPPKRFPTWRLTVIREAASPPAGLDNREALPRRASGQQIELSLPHTE